MRIDKQSFLLLAALVLCRVCSAQGLPPFALYTKRATLQETLLDTRAALTQWQKEQAALKSAVQWGAWHAQESLKPDDPPSVDLAAKGKDGNPLWSQRPDLKDGDVVTLGGNGSAQTSAVLCRTVTAKEPATLTVGLGGGDRIDVWVNSRKVASLATHLDCKRYGTSMRMEGDRRNQGLVNLPLTAGENQLVVSVRLEDAFSRQFFFSPSPDPVSRLWEQLRKDFPPANNRLLETVNVNWFGQPGGWFDRSKDTRLEGELLEAVLAELGPAGEPLRRRLPDGRRWLDYRLYRRYSRARRHQQRPADHRRISLSAEDHQGRDHRHRRGVRHAENRTEKINQTD